jgi:hypothetical protein
MVNVVQLPGGFGIITAFQFRTLRLHQFEANAVLLRMNTYAKPRGRALPSGR